MRDFMSRQPWGGRKVRPRCDSFPLGKILSAILYLADFPGVLVLPVSSSLKRPVELDGPGTGAIDRTGTTIPALFGMQDNRGFSFLGMGYIYINRAYLYTDIAPGTKFGIEKHRLVRCRNIRDSENFFFSHISLQ
jgi:hypothetical protein